MKYLLVCTILIGAVHLSGAADPNTPITEEELVRRTQELYDSIGTGNRLPWQNYFAQDCIYSDEKGRTMGKAALVDDISPLPPGYSGTIKLAQVQSRIIGDTAILSYDANETETVFGQHLAARYHITDTWLYRSGEWQIIASQAHRYYEDPAVGSADPDKFARLTGIYELAPGQRRTVSTEGAKLVLERNGRKEELFPETSELFFRRGIEGRILFHHDSAGNVDSLIDRRNNEDVVWRKRK